MTLEDFFTLTEMNSGLASPSRVRELVAVMEKESDCAIKNTGEAARQWDAVASAIAATENKECLELFIQLDGLQFIVKWLKEAQKLGDDSSDDSVEESITHMLQALGKLHVGYEKLVDSAMLTTVKDLLGHSSSKVKDKAQELFDSWKGAKDGDSSHSTVEGLEALRVGEIGKSGDSKSGSGHSESPQKEKEQESMRDEPMLSAVSDAVNADEAENTDKLEEKTVPVAGDDTPSDPVGSPSLAKAATALPQIYSVDVVSAKSSTVAVSEDMLESGMNVDEIQPAGDGKVSEGSGAEEAVKSRSAVAEHTVAPNPDPSSPEQRKNDDKGKIPMENAISATKQADELKDSKLGTSSGGIESWEGSKGFGAFLAGMADHGKASEHDEASSDDNLTSNYKFTKSAKENVRSGEKSDTELLGIVDPLEMARQVAIEVEREVVDYRRSGSGSGIQTGDNIQMPESPDSVGGRQSHESSRSSSKDASSEPGLSDEEDSPIQDETMAEQTNAITEATQDVVTAERDIPRFDLNQKFDLEDADPTRSQSSAAVTIVATSIASTSRAAAAAPGVSVTTPLELGSASSSAFRRVPDSEIDLPTGEDNSSPMIKRDCLDFDLNVADNPEVRTEDQPVDTLALMSSTFGAPGESSSAGANSKSPQLHLDLNHTSEDPAPPVVRQLFGFDIGANPSSSKLPSLKNIDLNDQPSFLKGITGSSSNSSRAPQSFNFSGDSRPDSSVISLLGTRVEVNRRTTAPQPATPSNGQNPEFPYDMNSGRAGNFLGVIPFAHSPVYGFNTATPPPVMPFPPTVFGAGAPIPYMVDARGTPVIPQIVGSTSAMPTGFQQGPFFMNMSTPPTPSNVGSSRSGFDPQLMPGGSRDATGFTQFLNLGPVRSMEEPSTVTIRYNHNLHASDAVMYNSNARSMEDAVRYNSQSSYSPVVGGKRKEPENGWDHGSVRNQNPPWK
ncbi:uncharacterized protein LOC127265183 [Andrographis paniculata]|uniref:uncharacterized protein LOC127265183 n=1 Tax=Andrographis paniculata TaxID=175694 RepID=UPI0021E73EA8|nr:uncharacterized protein LOC127265183 [Andrographis paniculata]XP_051150849.1 uncharacterized protein LOC127265183 [Andrographis paniculata]